jgi:hypothetical protein
MTVYVQAALGSSVAIALSGVVSAGAPGCDAVQSGGGGVITWVPQLGEIKCMTTVVYNVLKYNSDGNSVSWTMTVSTT